MCVSIIGDFDFSCKAISHFNALRSFVKIEKHREFCSRNKYCFMKVGATVLRFFMRLLCAGPVVDKKNNNCYNRTNTECWQRRSIMKTLKRILALIICATLIASCGGMIFASGYTESAAHNANGCDKVKVFFENIFLYLSI